MPATIFPPAHPARQLVAAFYGDGEERLGPALVDFFDTVSPYGRISELCQLMTRHGSDKSWPKHNYTLLYHFLFRHQRYLIRNVFELGIGTNYIDMPSNMGETGIPGASLRAWRDYFPRADIVGADIDQRILFREDRITTHYVDQTSVEAIGQLWRTLSECSFDIMIDDGLHTLEANGTLAKNSLYKLRPNGYYIIEDIDVNQENIFRFHELFTELRYPGALIYLPHLNNKLDNCLAIFRGKD